MMEYQGYTVECIFEKEKCNGCLCINCLRETCKIEYGCSGKITGNCKALKDWVTIMIGKDYDKF